MRKHSKPRLEFDTAILQLDMFVSSPPMPQWSIYAMSRFSVHIEMVFLIGKKYVIVCMFWNHCIEIEHILAARMHTLLFRDRKTLINCVQICEKCNESRLLELRVTKSFEVKSRILTGPIICIRSIFGEMSEKFELLQRNPLNTRWFNSAKIRFVLHTFFDGMYKISEFK